MKILTKPETDKMRIDEMTTYLLDLVDYLEKNVSTSYISGNQRKSAIGSLKDGISEYGSYIAGKDIACSRQN